MIYSTATPPSPPPTAPPNPSLSTGASSRVTACHPSSSSSPWSPSCAGSTWASAGTASKASKRGFVPHHHTQASGSGYADDIIITTGDAASLHIQLDKVSRYSTWSGMRLNANRCELSAIFHSSPSTSGAHSMVRVRRQLAGMHICGEPMTNIIHPNKPFKYLGIHFTLSLNWGPQFKHARDTITTMVAQLKEAPAYPGTALEIERLSIPGTLRHTFCVAPYNQTQLDALDRIRARAVKSAFRLPTRFPQSGVYASRSNFGIGHLSTTVAYVPAVIKHLFEALNDGGRLGTLARAMMNDVLLQRNTAAAAKRDLHATSPSRDSHTKAGCERRNIARQGQPHRLNQGLAGRGSGAVQSGGERAQHAHPPHQHHRCLRHHR